MASQAESLLLRADMKSSASRCSPAGLHCGRQGLCPVAGCVRKVLVAAGACYRVMPWLESLRSLRLANSLLPFLTQGPKPAPQQAMTERQVEDAKAANAAAEAAEAAAPGSGSGSAAQPAAVPVGPVV